MKVNEFVKCAVLPVVTALFLAALFHLLCIKWADTMILYVIMLTITALRLMDIITLRMWTSMSWDASRIVQQKHAI